VNNMKLAIASMMFLFGMLLVGLVGWIFVDLSQALEPFGGMPWTWDFVADFLQVNPRLPIMLVLGLGLMIGSIFLIRGFRSNKFRTAPNASGD